MSTTGQDPFGLIDDEIPNVTQAQFNFSYEIDEDISQIAVLGAGDLHGLENRFFSEQIEGKITFTPRYFACSIPVGGELLRFAFGQLGLGKILSKNGGKARSYACEQIPYLEHCFIDGQIEFDNNLNEGAIQSTKLGMMNRMIIDGEDTGWRSAVIYTFVEQIRRKDMALFAYF